MTAAQPEGGIMIRRIVSAVAFAMALAVSVAGSAIADPEGPSSAIPNAIHWKVPPGFAVELLASVPGARSMAMGDKGTLFVGTQRAGVVYAIRNALSADRVVETLLSGLKTPNGVAFRNGALYIAEPERILRVAAAEDHPAAVRPPDVVVSDLPYKNPLHAWKYLAFGPDGKLYVPVGSPCNVCNEPGFGTILRMNADGSSREIVAKGIRNSVGFTWHPVTGELWFTDNGRDLLGDDVPPCELNHAKSVGLDFGFPYCHAGRIADPEFGNLGRCEDSVPPAQALGPHVAPLGLKFYTGTQFPAEYRNQIFIAEHGSWNRTPAAGKTGYRVTIVRLKGDKVVAYEPFMEGFLDHDHVLGRPVDILVATDGSMLVSADTPGAIYRVSYTGPIRGKAK
jgi:glucose/arabinose dehydrogenase